MLAEAMTNDRASRSHLSHARWCMDVFAWWWTSQRERGWPSESLEARAMRLAAGATDTQGQAAYRGRVEVNDEGKTVPRDPPPFPKETRASGGARIPDIDRARIGPEVYRHLLGLVETGGPGGAQLVDALMAEHLWPGTLQDRAKVLDVSVKTYQTRYREGLSWLAGRMGRERGA